MLHGLSIFEPILMLFIYLNQDHIPECFLRLILHILFLNSQNTTPFCGYYHHFFLYFVPQGIIAEYIMWELRATGILCE